ncbi:hypothetical protein ACERZ8_01760 [Tateyamaria armeniaca]|uniref:Transmembrane protein n=1 Tax=Tateyamaria armeniaca TaxID=2518930 RepID=A0ABW8UNG6_9RHOB
MTRHSLMPFVMGAVMGLVMLWMLHMQITGEGDQSIAALVVFAAAHVGALAAILVVPLFAARRLAWVRRLAKHMHRPRLSQAVYMLAGAVFAAAITHVIIHGGVI